jgi:hypothetical protein
MPGAGKLVELVVYAAELRNRPGAGLGRPPGKQPRRQTFDVADDPVEFPRVFLGERSNGEARLARAARGDDVALLLQTVQRAAHRCPADAQPLRDVGFDDAAARRQPPMHDAVAELFVGDIEIALPAPRGNPGPLRNLWTHGTFAHENSSFSGGIGRKNRGRRRHGASEGESDEILRRPAFCIQLQILMTGKGKCKLLPQRIPPRSLRRRRALRQAKARPTKG